MILKYILKDIILFMIRVDKVGVIMLRDIIRVYRSIDCVI